MSKYLGGCVGLMLAGAAFAACGDDSGGGQVTDAGKDSGPIATPDAGLPTPDSGMTATGSVACGSNTCATPANPLAGLIGMFGGAALGGGMLPMPVACCVDATAGTCGLSAGAGMACEPPATPDMRCPSLNLSGLGAIAALLGPSIGAGCCTADGQCGLDGSLFGRGCVENSEAATMLAGMAGMVADAGVDAAAGGGLGGFLPMFPDPQRCDGSDADGGDGDAGN